MEHISNEEKARELSDKYKKLVDYSVEQCLIEMAEWKDEQYKKEKQQWIEKACDAYCKYCEYIGCDKFECLALEKFKKIMEK